jgi:hypothetical protein
MSGERLIQRLDGMDTRCRYRVDDGSRWRIVARELDTDPCPSSITTWRAYLSNYTPTHAPLYFDTLHRDAALDLPGVRRPRSIQPAALFAPPSRCSRSCIAVPPR